MTDKEHLSPTLPHWNVQYPSDDILHLELTQKSFDDWKGLFYLELNTKLIEESDQSKSLIANFILEEVLSAVGSKLIDETQSLDLPQIEFIGDERLEWWAAYDVSTKKVLINGTMLQTLVKAIRLYRQQIIDEDLLAEAFSSVGIMLSHGVVHEVDHYTLDLIDKSAITDTLQASRDALRGDLEKYKHNFGEIRADEAVGLHFRKKLTVIADWMQSSQLPSFQKKVYQRQLTAMEGMVS